jgi:hypothetical protein
MNEKIKIIVNETQGQFMSNSFTVTNFRLYTLHIYRPTSDFGK